MRRIRNSVKAIIISICVAAVVLGSIVGIVLVNRGKGGSAGGGNGGNKPNVPIEPATKYELTDSQKELVGLINASKQETEIATELDYSDFFYEDRTQINMSDITHIDDKFLSLSGSDKNSRTALIRIQDNEKVYYKDLFEILNIQENMVYRYFLDYVGNYIGLVYVTFDGSQYDYVASVYNFSDPKYPVLEQSVTVEDVSEEYDENLTYVNLFQNYFYLDIDGATEDKIEYYSYGVSDPIYSFDIDFEEVEYLYDSDFVSIIKNGNVFEFVYYNGTELNHIQKTFENSDDVYVCGNLIIVEKNIQGKNSYQVFNLKTQELTNFEASEDIVSITFEDSLGKYLEVFEKKSDGTGEFTYYTYDFEKVVEYEAEKSEDRILYYEGNKFLTRKGIMSTQNSVQAEYLVEFGSETFPYTLNQTSRVNKINNGTFVVEKNSKSYIMNMNAELIFEEAFSSVGLHSYEDGFYFGQYGEYFYILDSENKEMTEIENYADENYLIFNGGGLYITYNENDEFASLLNFKGEIVQNNLDLENSVYYKRSGQTIFKAALSNGNVKYYVVNKDIPISDEDFIIYHSQTSNKNNDVELYTGTKVFDRDENGKPYYFPDNGDSDWDFEFTHDFYGPGHPNFNMSNKHNGYTWDFNGSMWLSCQRDEDRDVLKNVGFFKIYVREGYYISNGHICIKTNKSAGQYNYNINFNHATITSKENTYDGDGNDWTWVYPARHHDSGSSWLYTYYIICDANRNMEDIGYDDDKITYPLIHSLSPIPCSIDYNNEDGGYTLAEGTPTTSAYGETETIPAPTKTGYSFVKWTVQGPSCPWYDGTNNSDWVPASYEEKSKTSFLFKPTTAHLNKTNIDHYSMSGINYVFTAHWTLNTYQIKFTNLVRTETTDYASDGPKEGHVTVKQDLRDTGESYVSFKTNNDGDLIAKDVATLDGDTLVGTTLVATSGTTGTVVVSYGLGGSVRDILISNPVRYGYTFTGWNITGMDGTSHWVGGGVNTSATSYNNVMAETGFLNLHSAQDANYNEITAIVTFEATWEVKKYDLRFVFGETNSTGSTVHLLLQSSFNADTGIKINSSADGTGYVAYDEVRSQGKLEAKYTPYGSAIPTISSDEEGYSEFKTVSMGKNSVNAGTTFQFDFNAGYDVTADDIYIFTGDEDKIYNSNFVYLNPQGGDSQHFVFDVLYVPVQIKDWAVKVNDTDGIEKFILLSKMNLYSSDGRNSLWRYISNQAINSTVSSVENYTEIELYAVYVHREYVIYDDKEEDVGFGSMNLNDPNIIDEFNKEYQGVNYQFSFAEGSADFSVNDTDHNDNEHRLLMNSMPVVILKINNLKQYVFDKIVIDNVGYRYEVTPGNVDYKYATIVITNNRDNYTFEVYEKGTSTELNTYEKTIDGQKYNFIDKISPFDDTELDIVNGFRIQREGIDEYSYQYRISFCLIGNPGDMTTKAINLDSVKGSGTYGFTITPSFRSNYSETDHVEITNNESSANNNFMDATGSQTILNTTPVVSQGSISVRYSGSNPSAHNTAADPCSCESAEDKTLYYFWLNGRKFTLINDSGVTLSGTDVASAGYYELMVVSSAYVECLPIQVDHNFMYAGKKFESYQAVKLADGDSKISNFGKADATSRLIVYCDGGVGDSIIDIYYVGGENHWKEVSSKYVYVEDIENQTENYTNFNSTQLIAITPTQTVINMSTKPLPSTNFAGFGESAERYELQTYLRNIVIGGNLSATYTLEINKQIPTTTSLEWEYEGYNEILDVDAHTGCVNYTYRDSGLKNEIYYFGKVYKVIHGYEISIGSGEANRKFILYYTVRNDSDVNNYVMYFIYTNIGTSTTGLLDIELQFAQVDKSVTTIVKDYESGYGELSDGSGKTATVEYYKNTTNAANLVDVTVGPVQMNKAADNIVYKSIDNFVSTYTEFINPDDLRIIKISPTNGNLLQSITIKIGSTQIVNLTLKKVDLIASFGTDGYASFITQQGEGAGDIKYTSLISYNELKFHKFKSYSYQPGTEVERYGIYYSESATNSWNVDENSLTDPAFESIYILVSGIYQNVQIDVKTISYIEFNFKDSTTDNVLKTNSTSQVVRYEEEHGGDYIYNITNDGKLFNLVEISLSAGFNQFYNELGELYDSSNGAHNVNDFAYVKYDGVNLKQICYMNKMSKELIVCQENLHPADWLGPYVIVSKENPAYTYMGYAGATLYLKDIANLSILIDTDEGADSESYIKLGVNHGYYDASLVIRGGNVNNDYVRVIFIGKRALFENGVSIFASGQDYSAYFTNGKFYNDVGNDAKGEGTAHSFQYITDFEGRGSSSTYLPIDKTITTNHEHYYYCERCAIFFELGSTDVEVKEVNGVTVGYCNICKAKDPSIESIVVTTEKNIDILSNDKLTYIYIENLATYFGDSIKNRAVDDANAYYLTDFAPLEFAEKYYLSLEVRKNEVTMNVNSYISNQKLTEGYSSDNKINYGTNSLYYAGVDSAMVNSGTLTINSDSRKIFNGVKDSADGKKGLAYSVTNGIANYQEIYCENCEVFIRDDATISKKHTVCDEVLDDSGHNLYCNTCSIAVTDSAEIKLEHSCGHEVSHLAATNPTGIMWINSYAYQLDYVREDYESMYHSSSTDTTLSSKDYYKSGSWFNDVMITNIDYEYYDENATLKNKNWQNNDKFYSSTKDPNHVIDGYKVSYKYYLIPGYYLEYIILETVDYGRLYIPIPVSIAADGYFGQITLSATNENLLNDYARGNSTTKQKLYYYIKQVITSTDNYYQIDFYQDEENDKTVSRTETEKIYNRTHNIYNRNSISLLSNNITVSFFSRAVEIQVSYDLNNNSDNISSKNTATNTETSATSIFYDSLAVLPAIATMQGYTFVGWGSESAVADVDRFDSENLTWRSDSSWIPIVGQIEGNNTRNYFYYQNRAMLINFAKNGSYGYDFYVKSSDSERSKTTGYFITDTGYAANVDVENYNFWSVYADVFTSTVLNNSRLALSVTLYAVWKANVYAAQIDMRDSVSATGTNGTTAASVAFREQGHMYHNWGGSTVDGKSYTISLADNILTYNSTANAGVETYYCYVTFDKNDWYLLNSLDVKGIYADVNYSAKDSAYLSRIRDFVCTSEHDNQLDFVIDRYGYSWLGWFSKNFDNSFESKNLAVDAEERMVFGSDYYYYLDSDEDNLDRTMPFLRHHQLASETFVLLSDFKGSQNDVENDIYSEFVYEGEENFKKDLNDNNVQYVYHYKYKSNLVDDYDVQGKGNTPIEHYSNGDFLNLKYLEGVANTNIYGILDAGKALVYFDTSLTLDVYMRDTADVGKFATRERDPANADATPVVQVQKDISKHNFRYITLYAYWLTNNYNVVIDYRDADETLNSIDKVGSSEVTNKVVIESSNYNDVADLTGDANKTINSTYFDDAFYDTVLNNSIPTRVGYDFVGWSYFFRDPNVYTDAEFNNGATTGDLYKYNGLTYASNTNITSDYILNRANVVNSYYFADKTSMQIFVLYDSEKLKLNATIANDFTDISGMRTCALTYVSDVNGYENLNTNIESFGDKEGDGAHYIYIFALWRAQTFTINVSLNVDTQNLTNSYDKDSAYSLGFYEEIPEGDPNYGNAEIKGYTGVNSLFLKQRLETQDIITYPDVYTEVVSNLTFVINFDEPFSTAWFKDPNAAVTKYYYLKDLFAISAGNYFIGWLYNSTSLTSKLIANSLHSEFGYTSDIVHVKEGESQHIIDTQQSPENPDITLTNSFDINFYHVLYNSNHKDGLTASTALDLTPGNESVFEQDNKEKLDAIDDSGASSSFGYIIAKDPYDTEAPYVYNKYYIQTEFVDNDNDYKTDYHRLYFMYGGKKYYVKFRNGTNYFTNDFNYLYYKNSSVAGAKSYVVRFDSNGNAYYVANGTYQATKEVFNNLNLKIEIYDSVGNYNEDSNDRISNFEDTIAGLSNNNIDTSLPVEDQEGLFKIFTTRQFTMYADWQVKEDFVFEFKNLNNGEYNEAVLLKSSASNPGLAGYASLYKNGDYTTPYLETQKEYDVGGGSKTLGEDMVTINNNYKFFDSFGFNLLPFFNGRYISKLNIDFERIETTNANTADVLTNYVRVLYRLEFKFEWDTVEHIVKISQVSLKKYDPMRVGDDKFVNVYGESFKLNTNKNLEGISVIQLRDENDIIGATDYVELATIFRSYLSVIDSNSFANTYNVHDNTIPEDGIFTITPYGNNTGLDGESYGRRDVNMLTFKMDELMSDVFVSYEYTLQTYDLKIHHIFDASGDTIKQETPENDSLFRTSFNELTTNLYNAENSFQSSDVHNDKTPNGGNQKLATVPQDLGSSRYNIPYGYFIYGTFYDSDLVGFRPMDDYYAVTKPEGYLGTTTHEYDGYTYIYVDGHYSKGGSDLEETILNGNATDKLSDQGSPILGSAATFPTKSVRFGKSFYLFKGFYEDAGISGGDVMFEAYDKKDEATYINRDIVLYGYYYSNNTPTNIQFYTWNNNWNENSPAYLPYKNNLDEYTLSSSEESSPYLVNNEGYLVSNSDATEFIDEEGRMILKYKVEYGVDTSGFGADNYNMLEISKAEISLQNTILRTYWYYEEVYKVLSADIGEADDVYISYDTKNLTEYRFASLTPAFKPTVDGYDVNSLNGMIVNARQLSDYTSNALTADQVEILAWVDTINQKAVLNGPTKQIVDFVDSPYDDMYAVYSPITELFYYFEKNPVGSSSVTSKTINEEDAFYYENAAGEIQKIRILPNKEMSIATYVCWDPTLNGGLGGYPDTEGMTTEEKAEKIKNLTIEDIYVYGKRFPGADLYAVMGNGDNAKYYKYHRIGETLPDTEFLRNNNPRYYVDIQGERYYTFIKKTSVENNNPFTDLYTKDGIRYQKTAFSITTLNNYYVVMDGVYHEIAYKQINDNIAITKEDGSSSIYMYVATSATTGMVVNANEYLNSNDGNYTIIGTVVNGKILINGQPEQNLVFDSDNNKYLFVYSGTTYCMGAYNSTYINPMVYESTVDLEYAGETKTYYFDYTNNSRTSGLFEKFEDRKYLNKVLFTYGIYTPINTNYTLQATENGSSWEASDITVNTFPSLNMDYWYYNKDYVLLGYLNVTDLDIAAMRRSEDSEDVVTSEQMFVQSLDKIVLETDYKSTPSIETLFATIDFDNSLVTITASGEVINLYYDELAEKYYFYYENLGATDSNPSGYYYFAKDEDNTIKIRQDKEGGQIVTAYNNYINDKYAGEGYYVTLRTNLQKAIGSKIKEFSLTNLLQSPINVVEYKVSTLDFKTIEYVTVRISSQFTLDWGDIEEFQLEEFCPGGAHPIDKLAVGDGSGGYQITISTTFNYTFSLVSRKTLINSNIYAIPVYVPDVIKFEDKIIEEDDHGGQTLVDTGSVVEIGDSYVTIDYMKMNVSHFDLETFRIYTNDFIWDKNVIYPEGKEADIKKTADYLQFVVLTEEQYQMLVDSKIGLDVKLSDIITGNDLYQSNDLEILSMQNATVSYVTDAAGVQHATSARLKFDIPQVMDGQTHNYYIVGFYYGIDSVTEVAQYVFEKKIEGENVERQLYTLQQLRNIFDPESSGMTEAELIAAAEATDTYGQYINFGKLTEIRYNKHIHMISDNAMKVTVLEGVIQGTTVVGYGR